MQPSCPTLSSPPSRPDRRALPYALSLAPMMDRTDRHFRYFFRLITRRALLYTEMVTVGAVLHGDRDRLLGFSEEEKPLALQLGGDDPEGLARCARLAEERGYDEVNLNVGCPSDRVQQGSFGACLMAEPERVARCVEAMRRVVAIPITVKHRIGIDHLDAYEDMERFVRVVAASGCDRFSIHARKAWLQGLSPKENREVPPLRYGDVHRLKEVYPDLLVEINGGVRSPEECLRHLPSADPGTGPEPWRGPFGPAVDGVMVGRAAYEDPYAWATADALLFGERRPPRSRREVVEAMIDYAQGALSRDAARGTALKHVTRHILGLFAGRPGAKVWKRTLSQRAHRPESRPELLREASAAVPEDVLDERPRAASRATPREASRGTSESPRKANA